MPSDSDDGHQKPSPREKYDSLKTRQKHANEVVEQHRLWLETNGVQGELADFHGINLEEVELPDANLSKAILDHADLRRAQLVGVDFSEAHLVGADLRNANLNKTDFSGADLQDAVLVDVKNLQAHQLAQSNLSGAKLPPDIATFDALDQVADLSKNARSIFLAMLLGCAYAVLTVFTTTDARLLTNSSSSPLPVIGTEIPIVGFYLAAPIILLAFFVYFHLHLQNNWELMADLPRTFPDGRSIDRKVYPWLINGIVKVVMRGGDRMISPLVWMQLFTSVFLAYGAVPSTLILIWARYLYRHDWWLTSFHSLVIALSVGFALRFYWLTLTTFRGSLVQKLTKLTKPHCITVTLVGFGLAMVLSMALIEDYTSKPLQADLVEVDVSVKPDGWTGDTTQIPLVKGARLKGRDLRYAQARGAFLVNADLRDGDISYADMAEANLCGADLRGSQAESTDFTQANLCGADLRGAILDGANLSLADLREADLRGTDLSDAIGFSRVQLEFIVINSETRLPLALERATHDSLPPPTPPPPNK